MGSWGPCLSAPVPPGSWVRDPGPHRHSPIHPSICLLLQPTPLPSLVRKARGLLRTGPGSALLLPPRSTRHSQHLLACHLEPIWGPDSWEGLELDKSCSFPQPCRTSCFSRPHCPSRYLGRLSGGPPGKFLKVSPGGELVLPDERQARGASHSQTVKIGGHSHQPLPNLTPLFCTLRPQFPLPLLRPRPGASLSSPLRAHIIRWATECVNQAR